MGTRDPRVDAYILNAPDFACPILTELRARVHAACPDVEETIKWRMPSFQYHGLLGGMAAFKEHATFGFWKSSLVLDAKGAKADEAMGQFGRLYSLKDLPPKRTFAGYIRRAMELNESGAKVVRRKTPRPAPATPADFKAALARNPKARSVWDAFSPNMQREYVDWITEAKTAPTREKRIVTSVGWIASGKRRNWKYMNC
ncbi:MAG: YdeI/OmpD-associated family protein [Gemmatimonadales bacterium]